MNKLVYYDSNTGLLKNVDGSDAGAKSALKDPYINLMLFLANNNIIKKEDMSEDAYKHWMTIRVMGNINIPSTAKPTIGGNINISGTGITQLPDNLTIKGDLNLSNCKNLKELPPGLKVGGTLDLRGTGLKAPAGTASKVITD
jgi:hypothetical protein